MGKKKTIVGGMSKQS